MENHRIIAGNPIRGDRLENTFKEFYRTIPAKIVMDLCEDDSNLLASQKIMLKYMFKILLSSVAVISATFILSLNPYGFQATY